MQVVGRVGKVNKRRCGEKWLSGSRYYFAPGLEYRYCAIWSSINFSVTLSIWLVLSPSMIILWWLFGIILFFPLRGALLIEVSFLFSFSFLIQRSFLDGLVLFSPRVFPPPHGRETCLLGTRNAVHVSLMVNFNVAFLVRLRTVDNPGIYSPYPLYSRPLVDFRRYTFPNLGREINSAQHRLMQWYRIPDK
ncbi:hypothetical protein HOY80DRAFT_284160 [Tuber brumale]|nr:hypothetical protein HOY80DRAFT_284160 [Tuber brumale]